MKRETVMLSGTYDDKKHKIAGWYYSQKLDGIRCLYDGGLTRGIPCRDIPWANTEKDSRLINESVATGLWSRYLKPIHAPNWWLDQLPKGIVLDGELYSTLGWQDCSKIVKRLDKRGDWSRIRYYVFDAPRIMDVYPDGYIDIPQVKKYICGEDVRAFVRAIEVSMMEIPLRTFEETYQWMVSNIEQNDTVKVLKQTRLSSDEHTAREEIIDVLGSVLERGGEGAMLRAPWSVWVPERSKTLLKVKGVNDDEGIVTGFVGGLGKLSHLFGSLILDYKGKRIQLSGFSDEERRMVKQTSDGSYVDATVPEGMGGVELGNEWEGRYFKRGDVVTFRYRELSDTGIPKELRYWRKRNG